MSRVARRTLFGLVAGVASLALLPGTIAKEKVPKQVSATIMAVAEDGTTWAAGEAFFALKDGLLKVTVDVATGVPDTTFSASVYTDPSVLIGVEKQRHVPTTDSTGDIKYTVTYLTNPLLQDPFVAWVNCSVKGSTVTFVSEQVTIGTY